MEKFNPVLEKETISEMEPFLQTHTSCPLCQKDIILNWRKTSIPYFGDVAFITAGCNCGFHFADTMILSSKEPNLYEITIETREDLNTRIIRSTSGTIHIPELGILVEPGQRSEAYVTNAEGVLRRIREVVETATRWSKGDTEKFERGLKLLNCLDRTIENPEKNKKKLTLVIKDPLGNSAIIGSKATMRRLTEKEANELKTGMIVLDADKDELIVDLSDEAQPLGGA